MINSRRKFIKNLTVGFLGGGIISSIPSTATHAQNVKKGIEIEKGYIVFNENTQKIMEALAEALIPGSKEIDMKNKVLNYVNTDRGAATIFDAGLWNIDSLAQSQYKKHFYELTEKKEINTLIKHIRARNTVFFNQFRFLIIRLYYSDSNIWKQLAYNGPPQTKGFLDYSEPPTKKTL